MDKHENRIQNISKMISVRFDQLAMFGENVAPGTQHSPVSSWCTEKWRGGPCPGPCWDVPNFHGLVEKWCYGLYHGTTKGFLCSHLRGNSVGCPNTPCNSRAFEFGAFWGLRVRVLNHVFFVCLYLESSAATPWKWVLKVDPMPSVFVFFLRLSQPALMASDSLQMDIV